MSKRGVASLSSRMALLALCAALGLALVPAASAAAAPAPSGGNAFNELVGGAQAHETTPTPTSTGKTSPTRTASTETTSGSNSKTVILLVFGAAIVLLIGIGFYIMRDARRVAPVGDGPVEGRPARDPAARLRKRRAQSKAARQQRKRNR